MKITELIDNFEIFTTNEENKILQKLKNPVNLKSINDHDKVKIENLIRKDLVTKTGFTDPTVSVNEKYKKD